MSGPEGHSPAVRRATLVGGIAVLNWATLALFTKLAGPVPPFQLVAMAFAIAFLVGLAWTVGSGRSPLRYLRQPARVWALGIGGLFGFHFCYFVALRLAPPVEANLINYTWPLLIVVFSALLPGERLRWFHLAGVLMGLVGAVLLIGREGLSHSSAHMAGYGVAFLSALIWSSYSVLSRRVGHVPTDTVAWFCGGTALLALICHLALEATVWPVGVGWIGVLCLGLGPVGSAFFFWDYGVKRGDIRALGAMAYGAPLLSTLLLIGFGFGRLDVAVGLACVLIVGGAVLAGREVWRRRPAMVSR